MEAPPTLQTIPREIRDRIYFFVFNGLEFNISIASCSLLGEHSTNLIFATCKQIRAESLEACCKHSTFEIWSLDLGFWLDSLPRSARRLLRNVHVIASCPDNGAEAEDLRISQATTAAFSGVAKEACKAFFFSPSGEGVWASELPEGFNEDDGEISTGARRLVLVKYTDLVVATWPDFE